MNLEELGAKIDVALRMLGGRRPAKAADRKPTTDGRPLTIAEVREHYEQVDRDVALQYAEDVNAVGRQLRAGTPARDCRSTLRRTVDAEDPHSWADAINRRGRELRGRYTSFQREGFASLFQW